MSGYTRFRSADSLLSLTHELFSLWKESYLVAATWLLVISAREKGKGSQ